MPIKQYGIPVPDSVVRFVIRRILAGRLRNERKRAAHGLEKTIRDHVELLEQEPIAVHTREANEQHYELPAPFFAGVLGPKLKYSCGYWPTGVETLAAAEVAALKQVCERARLQDGQSVLELGCGWGSLTLFMAERFPNSQITAVSNSASQRAFIEARAQSRDLRNVRVITADMNVFDTQERFDRVVSVEMFEHMRNYEQLLGRIASWLRPDGLLFVHIFTHNTFAYLFEDKGPTDWMARHFFTGGQMPSADLLGRFDRDMSLAQRWSLSGTHYQRTADAWLANMDRRRERLFPLFESVYGTGAAALWWDRWRIFFMCCSELWGYRGGREWGVTHYLFEPRSATKRAPRPARAGGTK